VARDHITAAAKATASFPFAEYQKSITSDLQQAEKENGMVYHVRVPEASTLGPIDKAVVAKPVPVSSPMCTNFAGEFRLLFWRGTTCMPRSAARFYWAFGFYFTPFPTPAFFPVSINLSAVIIGCACALLHRLHTCLSSNGSRAHVKVKVKVVWI